MIYSRKKADYLFTGGQVVTVNQKDSIAEAVAVAEDKIIFVGDAESARAYVDDDTKVIDISGKTLMPGFIDTHVHVCHTGAIHTIIIDVDPGIIGSIEAIKAKIKEAAEKKPAGTWISCWGYDEERMTDRRHPTREDLDEVAPDHFVQLCRYCGHAGVFNTKALEVANISMETITDFPEGQIIMRDGELTGLLHETAYYHMWQYVEFPEEDLLIALKSENDRLIEAGVTAVHDAGSYGARSNRAICRAARENLLDVRLFPMQFSLLGKEKVKEHIYNYIKTGVNGFIGNEKLKFGTMKIMLDGSSSGPSCAVRGGYSHDGGMGLLDWTQEEVNDIVLAIHKAGLQATAHAVGDRAVDMWLTAVENAQNEYPREDARHRIEHCAICQPDLVERIKNLDMIPGPNSAFLGLFGERYLKFYGDRVNDLFPCKSFLDAGIKSCIATDCSIVPENPMIGLYEAVTRKSNEGSPVGESQRISLKDAIRMYTYNPAHASFSEKEFGSIEEGKLADLTLWSKEIMDAPPETLLENECLMTMVGGKMVYGE